MKHLFAVLALSSLFLGQSYAQYQNKDYSLKPEYSDPTVVKGSLELSSGEMITVGAVDETNLATDPATVTKDAIVTKTDSSGNHLWSITFGEKYRNEMAHAVELTYDQNHVIVVGQADVPTLSTTKPIVYRTNVLAFKVNLSTGAVVWSKTYGLTTGDEVGLIIRRLTFNSSTTARFPGLYTIIGTSQPRTGLDQSKKVYAVSIFDWGTMYWDRRYSGGTLGLIHNTPFTATSTKTDNIMIAGTRYEINRPAHVFTMGVSPFDGSITDKYVHYNIDSYGYVNGGAIDRLKNSFGGGYALAFTTSGGASSNQSVWNNKVTVLKLNESRKVLWSKYYWEVGNTSNNGIGVYEHIDPTDPLYNNIDVFSGMETASTQNPGYISLNPNNGDVVYYIKHNDGGVDPDVHSANGVVRSQYGYIVKSDYKSGKYNNRGFSLARMTESGKTYCANLLPIKSLKIKAIAYSEAYTPTKYGKEYTKTLLRDKLSVGVKNCNLIISPADKTEDSTSSLASAETSTVYPNPIGTSGFTLKYNSVASKEVSVIVYNTLGAEVINERITMEEGINQIDFDSGKLSSGLNILIVYENGEVLETFKLMK